MNHASSFSTRIVPRRPHLAVLTAGLLAFGAAQHAAAETDREYCERQQGSAKVVCMRNLEQNAKPADGASSPSAARAAAPGGATSTPATAAKSTASDADRAYCERQQGSARVVCMRNLDKPPEAPKAAAAERTPDAKAATSMPAAPAAKTAAAPSGAAPYKVVDGYKVDAETMKGFRAWRAAACDRCHGANQEGLVGPSLIAGLKTLSKEEFIKVVRDGRLEKGMQSFGNSPVVMDNIDQLWAYLKGRSDGAITKAHVELMQ